MKAYPVRVAVGTLGVTSGAWNTPSQVPEAELMVSPFVGKVRNDPLSVLLVMASVPVEANVIPVAVDPLRVTAPVAVVVPVREAVFTTVGEAKLFRSDKLPLFPDAVMA